MRFLGILTSVMVTGGCSLVIDTSDLACPMREGTLPRPEFGIPMAVPGSWSSSDSWLGGLSADEELLALHRYTSPTKQQGLYTAMRGLNGSFFAPSVLVDSDDAEVPVFVERDGSAIWYSVQTSDATGLFRVRDQRAGGGDAISIQQVR